MVRMPLTNALSLSAFCSSRVLCLTRSLRNQTFLMAHGHFLLTTCLGTLTSDGIPIAKWRHLVKMSYLRSGAIRNIGYLEMKGLVAPSE